MRYGCYGILFLIRLKEIECGGGKKIEFEPSVVFASIFHTMSVSIRTENIQTTMCALNGDFSGRRDGPGYDESKPIHIHRRNRAYVWNKDMQQNFLDSILKGYYVPPIICSSRIVNGMERREVMEGGNRITTIRRIFNGDVRTLTHDEIRTIESHPITLVVMRNLTGQQTREMFRRLNKSVKVSDGQLYSMSEEDSPIVREALALLNDDDYPLRTRITDCFFDTRNSDNDGKSNLENAMALVSGALHGPEFITKSFARQEDHVENQVAINRNRIVTILGHVLDVFRMADEIVPLTDKRKMKSQWTVGNFLGAILYDVLMNLSAIRPIQTKWASYLGKLRNNDESAKEAVTVSGAQNISTDKLCRISAKVQTYLTENRILSREELSAFKHPVPTDEDEDDDTDDSGSDALLSFV